MNNRKKNRELENQIQDYQRFTLHLQEDYAEICQFRHDFKGMVSSIHMAIVKEDISELKRIYREVFQVGRDLTQLNRFSYFNIFYIHNFEIQGLLIEAINLAEKIGVDIRIEILEAIPFIPIASFDLIRLFSNLLNNAVQAASSSQKKKVIVSFYHLGESVIFFLGNSYKKREMDLKRIIKERMTTKGKGHGNGLIIINKVLEKYPSIHYGMRTTESDFYQEFTFKISEYKGEKHENYCI